MGVSVGASALKSGHSIYWASEGRSAATRQRASQPPLVELQTLAEVCATCDIIFSICPPHAAEDVARQVVSAGFLGLYCDANAISPARACRIGESLRAAGIDFLDGGIIGGPANAPGETWLYLSGERAQDIADCFASGPLETQVIGSEAGKASALKMCYAAYTKGTTALLSAILGAAEQLGVRSNLYEQWSRDDGNFAAETNDRVRRSTSKAWRFEGEMREIAATFESVGMPGGFHQAAAEIYARLASFQDAKEIPSLESVLTRLTDESD
jgi:3-hydroxyisobutyrate dehydrogenase-like beta-hydroxyacid dehydrogenase